MSRHSRIFFFGLSTLLGLRRYGWFIPYRYADRIDEKGTTSKADATLPIFAASEPGFASRLTEIDALSADLTAIGGAPPPAPRFDQDWFPRLDAATAYAMVRTGRPKRIVEIGSGHSTRFMVQAVTDGKLDCEITAIDPAPRASLEGLPIQVLRQTVQEIPEDTFAALAPGDIVFIDSSHILMPGSDVDILFNRVLPRLPAGVLVHIHDIFLPGAYPESWRWRGYNEQLLVSALLTSGGYDVVFSSYYVVTYMADRLRDTIVGELPLAEGAFESSLWLTKNCPAI